MLRYLVMLLSAACACGTVEAGQAEERTALIADFADVMGLKQIISASRDESRKGVATQGDVVIANLHKTGLSDEALTQVRSLYDDAMKQILESWSSEEATRLYSEAIAEAMSDSDLRKAVVFYKTREGQQSVKAASIGASRLQAYVQGSMTAALRTALADFTDKIRPIVVADVEKRRHLQNSQAPAPH
ncbi:MAG: hypothetical protein ACRDGM_07505 [bacterium]